MLISHPYRFIYTKTMKTAGTSVEIYFEDACVPRSNDIAREHTTDEIVTATGIVGRRGPRRGVTWYNHMRAELIRAQIGETVWNDYFKFCVVRNPFDKLVSYWWFAIAPGEREFYRQQDFSAVRARFCAWATYGAAAAVDRQVYQINGVVCADFFIRYETLLDGIESVCRRVGYPFQPERLGRYKSGARSCIQPFQEYFDKPAIAAVQALFGWELDYFGYRLA